MTTEAYKWGYMSKKAAMPFSWLPKHVLSTKPQNDFTTMKAVKQGIGDANRVVNNQWTSHPIDTMVKGFTSPNSFEGGKNTMAGLQGTVGVIKETGDTVRTVNNFLQAPAKVGNAMEQTLNKAPGFLSKMAPYASKALNAVGNKGQAATAITAPIAGAFKSISPYTKALTGAKVAGPAGVAALALNAGQNAFTDPETGEMNLNVSKNLPGNFEKANTNVVGDSKDLSNSQAQYLYDPKQTFGQNMGAKWQGAKNVGAGAWEGFSNPVGTLGAAGKDIYDTGSALNNIATNEMPKTTEALKSGARGLYNPIGTAKDFGKGIWETGSALGNAGINNFNGWLNRGLVKKHSEQPMFDKVAFLMAYTEGMDRLVKEKHG
jgi:hypothetical protein